LPPAANQRKAATNKRRGSRQNSLRKSLKGHQMFKIAGRVRVDRARGLEARVDQGQDPPVGPLALDRARRAPDPVDPQAKVFPLSRKAAVAPAVQVMDLEVLPKMNRAL
jgi:hypothetical protein